MMVLAQFAAICRAVPCLLTALTFQTDYASPTSPIITNNLGSADVHEGNEGDGLHSEPRD